MAATTTQTILLLACPACGDRVELHTTYDVHLGDIEPSANAKVSKATATLTITGSRVHHECPMPRGFSAGWADTAIGATERNAREA